MSVHVKNGDTVMVVAGRDKGKKGKVLEVNPSESKIIVEGINMISKHVKPKQAGQKGGIIRGEAALYACKVMLVCPKCGKPTRLGHHIDKDGVKTRACKNSKCGGTF